MGTSLLDLARRVVGRTRAATPAPVPNSRDWFGVRPVGLPPPWELVFFEKVFLLLGRELPGPERARLVSLQEFGMVVACDSEAGRQELLRVSRPGTTDSDFGTLDLLAGWHPSWAEFVAAHADRFASHPECLQWHWRTTGWSIARQFIARFQSESHSGATPIVRQGPDVPDLPADVAARCRDLAGTRQYDFVDLPSLGPPITVLDVTLHPLALPTDETPLEEIARFRNDADGVAKLRRIREWTRAVAFRAQDPTQAREELDARLADYRSHLRIARYRWEPRSVRTLVATSPEVIESLPGFASGLAVDGVVSVHEWVVRLFCKDVFPPGRELACVDADSGFSPAIRG
ncbi:MAG: hypothetical protein R3B81_15060 [bacterium]